MNLFGDDPVARKAKKRLNEYFDGRARDGFCEHVTTKVLDVLEDQLEYDFSRLNDTDDFSKELSVMWEIDSLADVEIIVALDEEFGIEITEKEARSMTTIRDIVEVIHNKLKVEQVGTGQPM